MTFTLPTPQTIPTGRLCFTLEIPDGEEWVRNLYSWMWLLGHGRTQNPVGITILEAQEEYRKTYDSLKLCNSGDGESNNPESITTVETIIKIKKEFFMCSMCCSCGGEQTLSGLKDRASSIAQDIGFGSTPVEFDTPTDSLFNSWHCQFSQYLIDLWYKCILDARQWIEIGEGETEGMQTLIFGTFEVVDGGDWYSYVWEKFYSISMALLHNLTESQSNAMRTFINNNRQELVNALYCAGTATASKQALIDYLESKYPNPLNMTRWLLRVWLEVLPYEGAFQSVADRLNAPAYSKITTSYLDNCVCDSVSSGELSLPSGDYVFVDMLLESSTAVNGGELTNTNNIYELRGGGNSGADMIMAEPLYNGSIVPNANRAGFAIQLILKEIVQGDDVGHNYINSSTQVSSINMGGGATVWTPSKWFAGAPVSFADMVTWLGEQADIEWSDPDCDTDEGKRVFRFLFYGGSTGNPPRGLAVFKAFWVVDTTGL